MAAVVAAPPSVGPPAYENTRPASAGAVPHLVVLVPSVKSAISPPAGMTGVAHEDAAPPAPPVPARPPVPGAPPVPIVPPVPMSPPVPGGGAPPVPGGGAPPVPVSPP